MTWRTSLTVHATRRLFGAAAVVGLGFLAGAPSLAQTSQAPGEGLKSAQARTFVAQAFAIAGEDLKADARSMCPTGAARERTPAPAPGTRPGRIAVFDPATLLSPTRVFDNVYFVGSTHVGATAIKTSAGIILIDTLSSEAGASPSNPTALCPPNCGALYPSASIALVPGLRQLGLDPADIKYVLLTHGHGDHSGGVEYLRNTIKGRFKVVMSKEDWAFVAHQASAATPPRTPNPAMTAGDIAFSGSYEVTLGDTTVTMIETPGHTPGTTGLIYPIRSDGRTYMATQWGGGGPLDPAVKVSDVERYVAAAKEAKTAIRWSSHTGGSPEEVKKLDQVRAGGANPFVEGQERVGRYLDVMLACKRAAVEEASVNQGG